MCAYSLKLIVKRNDEVLRLFAYYKNIMSDDDTWKNISTLIN